MLPITNDWNFALLLVEFTRDVNHTCWWWWSQLHLIIVGKPKFIINSLYTMVKLLHRVDLQHYSFLLVIIFVLIFIDELLSTLCSIWIDFDVYHFLWIASHYYLRLTSIVNDVPIADLRLSYRFFALLWLSNICGRLSIELTDLFWWC